METQTDTITPAIPDNTPNEPVVERFPFTPFIRIPLTPIEGDTSGVRRFVRKLHHQPGTVILGAARQGGVYATRTPTNKRQAKRALRCCPTRYIACADGSLRREDRLIQKRFNALPDDQKRELLSKVMAGVQKEAASATC